MLTAQEYLQKLGDLMGSPVRGTEVQITISGNYHSPDEAHMLIKEHTLKQKELRLLKREVGLTMQEISKSYVSQRVTVGKTVGWGISRGLLGRNRSGAFSMAKRNSLTMQKDATLSPYRQLCTSIDNIIIAIDKQKMKIQTALLEGRTDNTV